MVVNVCLRLILIAIFLSYSIGSSVDWIQCSQVDLCLNTNWKCTDRLRDVITCSNCFFRMICCVNFYNYHSVIFFCIFRFVVLQDFIILVIFVANCCFHLSVTIFLYIVDRLHINLVVVILVFTTLCFLVVIINCRTLVAVFLRRDLFNFSLYIIISSCFLDFRLVLTLFTIVVVDVSILTWIGYYIANIVYLLRVLVDLLVVILCIVVFVTFHLVSANIFYLCSSYSYMVCLVIYILIHYFFSSSLICQINSDLVFIFFLWIILCVLTIVVVCLLVMILLFFEYFEDC